MKEEDKQYCTIYLTRHGETEKNVQEIIQGHTDSPLTDLGVKQAEELREHLKDVHFDAVFSSDIMRAHRTAELASLDKKLAINTTKLLRERNFGVYEGATFKKYREDNKEILEKLKEASWEEAKKAKLYEGYEPTDEMVGRILTFFREVAVSYTGKNILVVSHGAIITALLVHFGFGERGAIWVNNTGYVILRSDGVDFFLDDTHNVEITEVNKALH